jgi:mannose-6-phosphate isomerase
MKHSIEELKTWLQEHHLFEALSHQVQLPLIPLPDNFTPPTRTPWGGTKILGTYKKQLHIKTEKHYPVVGESWEISVDPAAPSQFLFTLEGHELLIDFIQMLELFPEQILGQSIAARFEGQNPLLVKLLDAADHLSVQVHPSDDYEGLRVDESGKPESWYILEAEPGAGLYLGLRDGVTQDTLKRAIEHEDDVSQLLNFVEVSPGDFFVIDAGTIHAIGAGITLIEPQKIAPKKSGKTYRLWDWNRRYDDSGKPDPGGKPRELHVDDSFRVIDFEGLRGHEFITHIRPQPEIIQHQGSSQEVLLAETEHFVVSRIVLETGDELPGNCSQCFHGLVVYDGCLEILKDGETCATVSKGQSVILPALLGTYTLKGEQTRGVKVYHPA